LAHEGLRVSGFWSDVWRRFRLHRAALFALAAIGVLIVISLVAPQLSAYRFDAVDWNHIAEAPSLAQGHWFGTDPDGRDLFVRTFAGTRLSLVIALLATAVSLAIGVSYGAIAGYVGGLADDLMMRFVEVLSSLPLIFFVILLTVIVGRDIYLLFVAIGAVGWFTMARIVRGQTLSLRHKEFIEAAVAAGAGTPWIIARHIVPNVLGPVIVYATLTVPQIMLYESFLSFLGLGVQEPHSSLGTLIAEGAGEMETATWMLVVPGVVLIVLLLAFNVLGDGLRDALDPRGGSR
jgi:oligopeptide transport system permease protein